MTAEHRIVVLGAGYAGMSAAKRAAKARGARVTVVNARPEFVQRVRLHQTAVGQRVAQWDLRETLEAKGIEFVQARVTDIDPAERRVRLDDGRALAYDSLIYALGSAADRSQVPGAVEFAQSVATLEDTRRIPELSGRVAVVGSGATGIETAAELAEARPDLTVLLVGSEEPGAWLSEKARAHIRSTLARLGVQVLTGKVAQVHPDGLELVDGARISAGTVLWTTGFVVSEVAARSGLAVDARGRVLVDGELRSTSHPEVYAIGDAAVMHGVDGREMRMACATAIPAGQYAGRALATRLRGKQPAPYKGTYIAQCISLGRRDAVFQRVKADDSMTGTVFTGRTGAWFKEMIVKSTEWASH
ncbi:NAD(P)/FAD-dependent oxidoreductase [Nocardia huaxiensis]|uniref:NAD(P)/FAD-dependent oxidoreductase n=1 Tax=Nocardia huaxiensis TaxID=2755382 RepID=UPI001E531DE9|nr:FAD-dependent oxidoreductase [Nocardia huaxiensis]UFS94167.1 FAD-dependent oxidoreductase [Nocardia huaxiensis]